MKKISILFIACFLSGCLFWSIDYSGDLDFMYQTILRDHPGVCNDKDPDFVAHMEAAYKTAKRDLSYAQSDEKQDILTRFAQSFDDTHLSVS